MGEEGYMTPSETTASPRHRSVWWLRTRGLLLFVTGAASSWLGALMEWRWLQISAFLVGVTAMGILFLGEWRAYQVRRARYWEWWEEQYERNDRELRAQAARDRARSGSPPA